MLRLAEKILVRLMQSKLKRKLFYYDQFLFEIWWRPWRRMTSLLSLTGTLCARRVAWFGIVWELCWLVTAQANWSRRAATSFQRRLVCALWNQIVPNSESSMLESKVIVAVFLTCQVRILIDAYDLWVLLPLLRYLSSSLLLLAFDRLARSRLQWAILDRNRMSCQRAMSE